MTKLSARLLMWGLLAVFFGAYSAYGIDCQPPVKPVKALDSQVNKSIIWFGSGKGGDVRERVKGAAKDIVRMQPEADHAYVQQAMLFTYCSALRDDPRITEAERVSLQTAYAVEVRKVFAEFPPAPVKRQNPPTAADCKSKKSPDLVLQFRKNSYALDDEELRKLDNLAKRIKKTKKEGICLAGYAHTGKGTDQDNTLSLTRLAAVRYALLRNGIPELSMTTLASGPAPSGSPEKKLPGDRVEIWVPDTAPHQ
jgi:outer membrane protein OmpA-like peptidoglycan-associated protein